ncbi:MAG: hypothetical protein NUW22_08260 [Acidobacteria bacterium]|nr:hypothetical protein [Acidobacteriota bacterium]
MYAIVGLPGSQHHTYRWFARSDRRQALAWLSHTADEWRKVSPALGYLHPRLISDRQAEAQRYRDGSPIYSRQDADENAALEVAEREHMAELERAHA